MLLAGDGAAALDGSEYQKLVLGEVAGRIPAPDLVAEARLHRFLAEAAERRLLQSAHDVADGVSPGHEGERQQMVGGTTASAGVIGGSIGRSTTRGRRGPFRPSRMAAA